MAATGRRAPGPRLIVGTAALVVTVAVGAIPMGGAGALMPLLPWFVGAAVGAGVIGVAAGVPGWGPAAAGILGAEHLLTLHDRGPTLDGRTPLVAAGLLLVAELVAWGAELRTAGAVLGRPRASRLTVVALSTVAAYALTTVLGLGVTLPVGRDLAVTAGGAAAVALVTVVLLGLARRRTGDGATTQA